MKRYLSALPVALLIFTRLACAAANEAAAVSMANPNFDEDELFCYGCYYPAITGWTVGPNSRVQKSNVGVFPGGIPGGGTNFAYVGMVTLPGLSPRL
jgi:hypothetical protein